MKEIQSAEIVYRCAHCLVEATVRKVGERRYVPAPPGWLEVELQYNREDPTLVCSLTRAERAISALLNDHPRESVMVRGAQ